MKCLIKDSHEKCSSRQLGKITDVEPEKQVDGKQQY